MTMIITIIILWIGIITISHFSNRLENTLEIFFASVKYQFIHFFLFLPLSYGLYFIIYYYCKVGHNFDFILRIFTIHFFTFISTYIGISISRKMCDLSIENHRFLLNKYINYLVLKMIRKRKNKYSNIQLINSEEKFDIPTTLFLLDYLQNKPQRIINKYEYSSLCKYNNLWTNAEKMLEFIGHIQKYPNSEYLNNLFFLRCKDLFEDEEYNLIISKEIIRINLKVSKVFYDSISDKDLIFIEELLMKNENSKILRRIFITILLLKIRKMYAGNDLLDKYFKKIKKILKNIVARNEYLLLYELLGNSYIEFCKNEAYNLSFSLFRFKAVIELKIFSEYDFNWKIIKTLIDKNSNYCLLLDEEDNKMLNEIKTKIQDRKICEGFEDEQNIIKKEFDKIFEELNT